MKKLFTLLKKQTKRLVKPAKIVSLCWIIACLASPAFATTSNVNYANLGVTAVTASTFKDWASDKTFTLNNFGTVGSSSYSYKRVGDTMLVSIRFSGGAGSPSAASITLPNAINTSSARIPSGLTKKLGDFYITSGSNGFGAGSNLGVIFWDGSDSSKVYFSRQSGSDDLAKMNGNTFTSGTGYQVDFSYPVSGWDSTYPVGTTQEVYAAVETPCTADPCTITRQGGTVSNGISAINRSSTGTYVAHFTAGTFSSAPWKCTVQSGFIASGGFCRVGLSTDTTISSSGFSFTCENAGGSATNDTRFYISCHGPK